MFYDFYFVNLEGYIFWKTGNSFERVKGKEGSKEERGKRVDQGQIV